MVGNFCVISSMKRLWLILPLLFILSCEDKKDTTPPEVNIVSPISGSTVNELVTITCISTDNKGIEKVDLWIDGQPIGVSDSTEPYSMEWNSTTYDDKSYTITVRAYDRIGNMKDSDPISLIVDNTLSLPNPVNVIDVSYTLTEMTVKWTQSTDSDFSEYKLFYSESESGTKQYVETYTDISNTAYTTTTFDPTQENWYWIEVTDTYGYSTLGEGKTNTIDSPPTQSVIDIIVYKNDSFNISWSQNNNNDFSSYELYEALSEDMSGQTLIYETNNKADTSYVSTGIEQNQIRYYQVVVIDVYGFKSSSSIASGSSYFLFAFKNTDGGVYTRRIQPNVIDTIFTKNISPPMAFTSDGTKILVSGGWDWFIIDVYGNILNTMNTAPVAVNSPQFSPDDSKIVFSSWVDADYGDDIFQINIDGTNLKRLTENYGDDNWPHYSPDGSHIFFQSNKDGDFDIYKMDIDGSNIINLTNNNNFNDGQYSISPDGTKIVYRSFPLTSTGVNIGPSQIIIMNSDGSNKQYITDENNTKLWPVFSPNGEKIAYYNPNSLYIMNYDGSNKTRLNQIKGNVNPQLPASFSPDGSHIVFVGNGWNVNIVDMDGNELNVTDGWSGSSHGAIFQNK